MPSLKQNCKASHPQQPGTRVTVDVDEASPNFSLLSYTVSTDRGGRLCQRLASDFGSVGSDARQMMFREEQRACAQATTTGCVSAQTQGKAPRPRGTLTRKWQTRPGTLRAARSRTRLTRTCSSLAAWRRSGLAPLPLRKQRKARARPTTGEPELRRLLRRRIAPIIK